MCAMCNISGALKWFWQGDLSGAASNSFRSQRKSNWGRSSATGIAAAPVLIIKTSTYVLVVLVVVSTAVAFRFDYCRCNLTLLLSHVTIISARRLCNARHLSVRLFVCLLATLCEDYWTDLRENFTTNVTLTKEVPQGSGPDSPWIRPLTALVMLKLELEVLF